jgi:hypothetical protein
MIIYWRGLVKLFFYQAFPSLGQTGFVTGSCQKRPDVR